MLVHHRGAGGDSTVYFAVRKWHITAVDIGSELMEFARMQCESAIDYE